MAEEEFIRESLATLTQYRESLCKETEDWYICYGIDTNITENNKGVSKVGLFANVVGEEGDHPWILSGHKLANWDGWDDLEELAKRGYGIEMVRGDVRFWFMVL